MNGHNANVLDPFHKDGNEIVVTFGNFVCGDDQLRGR
jgi:hypothetical protein